MIDRNRNSLAEPEPSVFRVLAVPSRRICTHIGRREWQNVRPDERTIGLRQARSVVSPDGAQR